MVTRRVEHVEDAGDVGRRRVTTYESAPVVDDVVTEDRYEVAGEDRVVHPDPADIGRGFIRTVNLSILAFLVIAETLLAFRLGFLAAGANSANGFVDFIYDATGWMVEPFDGIIANEAVGVGGVFEWATLIAMIVYAVAAMLLVMLLSAIGSFPSLTGERTTVSRSARQERTAHDHLDA